MSESTLVLPVSAEKKESPKFDSVFTQKAFVVDFTGWKKGNAPIGFWQLHLRLQNYVKDSGNAGHLSKVMMSSIGKLDGLLRICGQLTTIKEQYDVLLEAAYQMSEICQGNPNLVKEFSVEVIPLAEAPSSCHEEPTLRYEDHGALQESV